MGRFFKFSVFLREPLQIFGKIFMLFKKKLPVPKVWLLQNMSVFEIDGSGSGCLRLFFQIADAFAGKSRKKTIRITH